LPHGIGVRAICYGSWMAFSDLLMLMR